MINQLIMIASFHPRICELLHVFVFLYLVAMERYDGNNSFKSCPARRVSQHLCFPWTAIPYHAGANSNSRVFVSFAYLKCAENFNPLLLKDSGRRSHIGNLWAASSPQVCFV